MKRSFDPNSIETHAAILRVMARTDFPVFAKQTLYSIIPRFKDNWHIDALLAEAMAIADGGQQFTIINAPPRSLKSVIFSSVLPAFILGQDPAAAIVCLSHSQDLASKLARDTLRIMQSPFYAKVFPETRLLRVAVDDFMTTKGGYRLASSIGGGITGRGADFMIIDDPMRAGDASSETIRPGLNAWFDESLPSRLNVPDKSAMILVMQRLHQDDLTGHLLESGDWKPFVLPAIAEEDRVYNLGYGRSHLFHAGDLMHEERLSAPVLARLKRGLGSRVFDAQFQQNPVPADGQIFKRAWFKHGPVILRTGDRIIQSWDAASKGGNQNDYSVCITAIVRRSEILILDVFRGRLEFPELKRKAVELGLLHKPSKLLIEDAAAGTQLIQILRAEQPRGMPLPIAVKAVTNKIERANIAAARIESGALILPASATWLDDFMKEMLAFPTGKHDDQVDAIAHLMAHTQNESGPRVMPWFGGSLPADLMHAEIDKDIKVDF